MKTILLLLAGLIFTAQLQAQSNAPVRLAILPETPDTGAAADVLTAEFTKNANVHLLERAEIERVYREQGMSAANRDDLKLGRILGADGLLLLGTSSEGTNQFVNVRLVAVKPGVVLVAERFPWPMKDLTGWSPLIAKRLDGLLPKLTVLEKDAIPISVVNLRSAIQSDQSKETEAQLKLLTIQRLSREPRLFVLERQRMEMMSEEKALKSDESAFWDGSYLLEGIVDQNGYSRMTVTINGRLTPPKGGATIQFEVSGNRTSLVEVINQLAAKVDEALKVKSSVPAWNAADEAQQYFDEAQWALKWGIHSEAQAAVESAWALGKKDLACAVFRVSACKNALPEVVPTDLEKFSQQPGYRCVQVNEPPDSHDCDVAIHALQCYYDFSRNPPEGVDLFYTPGTDSISHPTERQSLHLVQPGRFSDWYQLGLDTLVAASQVLWHYDFNPQSQPPVVGKLADLRVVARSVDKLISQSSAAHDAGILHCELNWGCFWQETPENGVALYRELMSSPTINQLHEGFWFRSSDCARLAAWNDSDRKRLAQVWNAFLQETDVSTNVLLKMEGKAVKLRDATKLRYGKGEPGATDEKEGALAITNFFEALIVNRCAFVTNHIEWNFNILIEAIGGDKNGLGGIGTQLTPQRDRLEMICSDYSVKLRAKDDECSHILTEQQHAQAFERQKRYLTENKPFNSAGSPQEFTQLFLFGFKDYSKPQAADIRPLLSAYKSNLLAQIESLPVREKGWARIGVMQVGQVEGNVDHKDVETFLQAQTLGQLQTSSRRGQLPSLIGRSPFRGPREANGSIDQQASLKASMEAYWQNPDSVANWPTPTREINTTNRGANP